MGIELTAEEMRLIDQGKLKPQDVMEHRKTHPVRSINQNEVGDVKQEIKETNILYRQSIDRNKELYGELQENRKRKEELRNKIAELRTKKKKLLGLE